MRIALFRRISMGFVSRLLLAIPGNYVLTSLVTASLSLLPWLPRAQMVLLATMLAFLFFCGVVIWAFAARSVWQAWGLCLLMALPPLLHLGMEGRL